MSKDFNYPDTVDYQAAYIASKTRRLSQNKFEAVAAFYFMGKHGLTLFATGETRARAQGIVMRAIEAGSARDKALESGLVSYTPAI